MIYKTHNFLFDMPFFPSFLAHFLLFSPNYKNGEGTAEWPPKLLFITQYTQAIIRIKQ